MARLVRLIVGLGLTALALWLSHPRDILRTLAGTDPLWIAAAVALVVIDRALMAYRWIVLLRTVDPIHRPPLRVVLRIFFVSTFVGTFLPSVGGDVVRAYSLSKHGVRGMEAGVSVLMDRFLGAVSILLVAAVSLLFASEAARRATLLPTLVAAVACVLVFVVLFSRRAEAACERLLGYVPFPRVRDVAGNLLQASRRYGDHRSVLANVTAGSIGVQVLRIVQAYCLGRALHIATTVAPLGVYFALIPLVLLIMLLPVTVNGIGTSQLAFIWLFGAVGVGEPQAFALSVLFVALGAVGNLPGGLLYAFGGERPAPHSQLTARDSPAIRQDTPL